MKHTFIYLLVCALAGGCAVSFPDRLSGSDPELWARQTAWGRK